MVEFRFLRWLDPEKRWALFLIVDTGQQMVVPRSRLIPHPLCQYELEAQGIRDPNRIAEICAERNSLFGIPIFRHYLHLIKKGDYMAMDAEEWEKTYYFPPHVDFSKVRDLILQGWDIDEAIAECSSW